MHIESVTQTKRESNSGYWTLDNYNFQAELRISYAVAASKVHLSLPNAKQKSTIVYIIERNYLYIIIL